MANDKINFKLVFQDMRKEKWASLQEEVKRIDMDMEKNCVYLVQTIESGFAHHHLKRPGTGVRITYKDIEGDWVTLENDKDLGIAIEEASGQIVQLNIVAYDEGW